MKLINFNIRKNSIRTKSIQDKFNLIAIVFLIFISISFISISSILSHDIITTMITKENLENVKGYSNLVSNVINRRFRDIKLYAEDPVVKTMDWKQIKPYLEGLENESTEQCCFIGLVDKNEVLTTNKSEVTLNISNFQTLKNSIKNNYYFIDRAITDLTGHKTINVATEIRNGENSLGYLLFGININKMLESINILEYDKDSYFYIVDKDGKIVLHPKAQMELTENITIASENVSEELVKEASNILHKPNGKIIYEEFGEDKISYFYEIPDTGGWKLIVVKSYYNSYTPITDLLVKISLWGLFIIILGIIIVKIIVKNITKPIVLLTDVFNNAATGDLNVIADESEDNEIGRAARSFNIMMEKIKDMTFYDPLTGLLNRNAFMEGIKLELEHVKEEEGKFSIFYIAIDKFKNVNDVLGHVRGDILLREIAVKLKDRFGKNHMISRLSGDEFIIFAHEYGSHRNSSNLAEDILEIFRQPWNIENHEFYITASIGIATYPEDGLTEEEIIKNAGIAKSKVKELGGDNFKFYNKEMNDKLQEQVTLDALLHNALENNEFELYYQPLISLKTKRIDAVEALIRWNNKELGMMSPGKFIPRIEETGLIVPIGRWILKEACRQSKLWQDNGLKPIYISVNVSAYQFEQKDFVQMVADIINETRLNPKYLELEITEGVAMDNVEDKIRKLSELKSLGVKIAIDDFGTGYSSLNYLRRFPIDNLKIDQSFVRDISNNSAKSIISTIVSIGKNLNLGLIAEGVETQEQLKFMTEEQCDKIQGFIFSKPMNKNSFTEMLSEDKEFVI